MNILVLNADGPDSFGLSVLKDAVKSYWKESTVYTVVPGAGGPYSSMGADPNWRREVSLEDTTSFKKLDSHHYIAEKFYPADVIDYCFLRSEIFLPANAAWDLVFAGVSAGHCVGTDILRSGTVGAALYASATYRVGAHAFAQHLGEFESSTEIPDTAYKVAQQILPDYFRTTKVLAGECWMVNFPPEKPQGYQNVTPAHYSARRMPPVSVVPRARDEKSDVTMLEKGWITTSLLNLRVAQPLRY